MRAKSNSLERDEQVAEWIKITERQSAQIAPKGSGHRPEVGINAAARELGVERTDAQRLVKIASLSDDAKDAAREVGLDTSVLAIDVACSVAMAPFDELEAQSFRLADLVQHGELPKQEAVDMLYAAAVAADLVRVHGADAMQDYIAAGFEVAA